MKKLDHKPILAFISGFAMIALAAKQGNKQSRYFSDLDKDLNEVDKMYYTNEEPNSITKKFSSIQGRVHSGSFNKMNISEQKMIASKFAHIGKKLMGEV
jgi:hypothetical protein